MYWLDANDFVLHAKQAYFSIHMPHLWAFDQDR